MVLIGLFVVSRDSYCARFTVNLVFKMVFCIEFGMIEGNFDMMFFNVFVVIGGRFRVVGIFSMVLKFLMFSVVFRRVIGRRSDSYVCNSFGEESLCVIVVSFYVRLCVF